MSEVEDLGEVVPLSLLGPVTAVVLCRLASWGSCLFCFLPESWASVWLLLMLKLVVPFFTLLGKMEFEVALAAAPPRNDDNACLMVEDLLRCCMDPDFFVGEA